MRIRARLAPGRSRLWQQHVVAALASRPEMDIGVNFGGVAVALPPGAEALLALDGLLARRRGEGPGRPIASSAFDGFARGEGDADLVIDLAGAAAGQGQARDAAVLSILCDGQPLEAGALVAALDGRSPVLETRLRDREGKRVLSRWWPAVESPNHLGAAFDMLLGRAAHMLIHEAERIEQGRLDPPPPVEIVEPGHRGAAAFLAGSIRARIAARIDRLLHRAPNWYVAWRRNPADPAGLPNLSGRFERLPDDGARFYADPFLWRHGGETLLFVEEFPFSTGKGILSLSRLGQDGSFGTPRPILETDCHLSYPFVFAEGGAMWMIPETSGRRTVELYRADPFPDRWQLHTVLLENIDLADVTIREIGGRFWMFAASREPWTSSWDALSLFHAPTLFGPWTPHAGNPVLVDLRAARPGGRILDMGGEWVRPVQDCEAGYGAALGFAAVDVLTPDAYGQTLRRVERPAFPDSGLHSYDRAGDIEVIDRFGPAPR